MIRKFCDICGNEDKHSSVFFRPVTIDDGIIKFRYEFCEDCYKKYRIDERIDNFREELTKLMMEGEHATQE